MKAREIEQNRQELETSGIYKITNLRNNKYYIGRAENFYVRWNQHLKQLNKGIHVNTGLQKEWDESNFDFSIIEQTGKIEVKEIKHIYEDWKNGNHIYNDINSKLIISYFVIQMCKEKKYKFVIDYKHPDCLSDKGSPLVFSFIIKNPETDNYVFLSLNSAEYNNEPKNIRNAEIKSDYIKKHDDYFQVVYDYVRDDLSTHQAQVVCQMIERFLI